MYVLVTNDDGIDAPALMPFKQALDQAAETIIFAPDHNWSASGHPKTMHKPLRVDPVTLPDGSQGFSSSGAPSDCVALAFLGIIERKLDLIVSGINRGANLGYDIFYSGTVAAAVEGVINGIPAIAFSFDSFESVDYSGPASFAARLVQYVERHGLPANLFLNVNFPAISWDEVKGVAVTRLGRRVYRDELVTRTDPRGRPYYWIGGTPPGGVPDSGTDIWAVANGYVSVTPVTLDMTAYHFREDMRRWNLQLS
ncbi:MAG: 5'/3'-nucleotidase SurE [Anaerolineae bacterium]|jgi:5'-nucleotidase